MNANDGKSELPLDRWIAVLKYRGMDTEALIMAQRRNLQTLSEATDLVARGIKELAAAQANLMREQIDRASEALPGMTRQRTLDEMAREQIDFSRGTMNAAIAGFQELSEMLWQCNRQAVEVLNRSLLEGFESVMKSAGFPGANGSAPPASADEAKEEAGQAKTRRKSSRKS
ncbi:MAG: phasin family protein [Alphaproteobacteria bacterium]|nr:phasin family protein [Alphaproteobacteria bacterium]